MEMNNEISHYRHTETEEWSGGEEWNKKDDRMPKRLGLKIGGRMKRTQRRNSWRHGGENNADNDNTQLNWSHMSRDFSGGDE